MIFSSSIPFVVPAKFQAAVEAGQVARYGAILKNETTGRIVGHLQETGALRKLVHAGLSVGGGPLNTATGIYGIVQNEQIKSRLDAMQAMMGSLQSLNIASLALSAVGIGVTVASTMMTLQSLRALKTDLLRIEETIERIPAALNINSLIDVLVAIETQLERIDEAGSRRQARPVLEKAEEALHAGFNTIVVRLQRLQDQGGLDAAWVAILFRGLALCGDAQCQALLRLDDAATLASRSRNQIGKLEQLALALPRDVLEINLGIAPATAERLALDAAETRMRFASTLMLAEQLQVQAIPGPKYLARASSEQEQPLLVLPHMPALQAA